MVNDNAGQLFQFEKLAQGETWVTRDAVSQINAQRLEDRLPTVTLRYATGTAPDIRALGSLKRTDLLVLGLRTVPSALDLDPRSGRRPRRALFVWFPAASCCRRAARHQ